MTMFYGAPGLMTLEALTDAPCPRIRITLTDLGSTTVVVKITRTVAGETATVPGARARDSVDSDVIIDYAAPLNIQTTYTLYVDGVIADVKTITLTSATGWMQDPLQPDRALPIKLDGRASGMVGLGFESFREYNYQAPGSTMPIMGDPYPTVFGGQRQAASSVQMLAQTVDADTREAFKTLISDTTILLVRPMPSMVDLPPVAYLYGDVNVRHETINAAGNWTVWAVTGSLIRAVQQSAISGFITYDEAQELLAPYTYDEVQTVCAGTTYLDWQKNPLIFSTL